MEVEGWVVEVGRAERAGVGWAGVKALEVVMVVEREVVREEGKEGL
jgi:hypothetical protein